MEAWIELNEQEYDFAWDNFSSGFKFSPSSSKFPGMLEPISSATYFLGHDLLPEEDVDDFYDNLLKSFQEVLPLNGRMYALDWQHACFWFYPHYSDKSWKIGLPDGDYAIFIAEDFSFGYFGHPWEATICVFGEPMLEAFQKYSPKLFEKVIRKNGKPVA